MDPYRFDQTVRTLGGTPSRRGITRLALGGFLLSLSGAALGGILAGLPVVDSAAKRRHRKRKKNKTKKPKECNSGNCDLTCHYCEVDGTCANLTGFPACAMSGPGDFWYCVDGVCTYCGQVGKPCCAGTFCGINACCVGGMCANTCP